MRALQFSTYGGPEVLQWAEAPEPHAGPGKIRIAVRAAGVNLRVRRAAETRRYLEDQHRFYAQLVKDFGLEPR